MGIPMEKLSLSNGWLHKFKARHNVRPHTLDGGSDGSVTCSEPVVDPIQLQHLLSEYSPEDVFNLDETALLYRLPPKKALLIAVRRNGKNDASDRITVALYCNLTGSEKMASMIVGRTKCARPDQTVDTAFDYYSNPTACQDRLAFTDWLRRFDAKMFGRKVLLLLAHATRHCISYDSRNFRLQFLPSNKTCTLQPLGNGIIRSFKAHYRRRLVMWLLDAMHAQLHRPISLLQATRFVVESWRQVPLEVIQHAWVNSTIVPQAVAYLLKQQRDYTKPVDKETDAELARLLAQLDSAVSVEEYVGVDDNVETHSDDDLALPRAPAEEREDDLGSLLPKPSGTAWSWKSSFSVYQEASTLSKGSGK